MSVLQKPGGDHAGKPRRRRQWTIPAPPAVRRTPFEGASILDEVPDPLRLILWTRLRDVLLWASVGLTQRSALFAEQPNGGRTVVGILPDRNPGDLVAPLGKLNTALFGIDEGDPVRIADACLQIATWAGQQGYLQTASHFAEAAAAVRPRDPGPAFASGRAARWQAAYERAEQWFDRSLALARRSRDYAAYIDARLGWGTLYVQRGELAAGRRQFTLAWRTARKHKIRALGAAAQHNLLALAYEEGRYEEAAEHSRMALKLYRWRHANYPYIAHDTAQLWAARGFFAPALSVFEAVLPFITAPTDRVQTMANIGRAAAGVGNHDRFYEAWNEVTHQARQGTQYVAAAYINLAEGALLLHTSHHAANLAERGLELARQRGERVEESRARALLDRLRHGRQPDPVPEIPSSITELCRDLVGALDRLRDVAALRPETDAPQ